MKNQASSPAKTGILLVGAGGSLALAYWSISQAMAPPPKPPVQAPATLPQLAPAKPLVTELKGDTTELPSTQSTQNMIAHTPAAQAVQDSIGILAARQQGAAAPPVPTRPITGESALAPGADPFLPYVQPAASNAARPVAENRATPLPTYSKSGTAPATQGAAPALPPPPVEPELAGTLMGDRPSAVFRVGKHLATVATGETFDGWTVVQVADGEAVVRRMNARVHLHIGMAHSSSPTVAQQDGIAPLPAFSRPGSVTPLPAFNSRGNAFHPHSGHIATATPEEVRQGSLPTDVLAAASKPESPANTVAETANSSVAEPDHRLVEFTTSVAAPVHTVRFPVYQPDASNPQPATRTLTLHAATTAPQSKQHQSRPKRTKRAHARHLRAHRLRHRRHHRRHARHAQHSVAPKAQHTISQAPALPVAGKQIASLPPYRFSVDFQS